MTTETSPDLKALADDLVSYASDAALAREEVAAMSNRLRIAHDRVAEAEGALRDARHRLDAALDEVTPK